MSGRLQAFENKEYGEKFFPSRMTIGSTHGASRLAILIVRLNQHIL